MFRKDIDKSTNMPTTQAGKVAYQVCYCMPKKFWLILYIVGYFRKWIKTSWTYTVTPIKEWTGYRFGLVFGRFINIRLRSDNELRSCDPIHIVLLYYYTIWSGLRLFVHTVRPTTRPVQILNLNPAGYPFILLVYCLNLVLTKVTLQFSIFFGLFVIIKILWITSYKQIRMKAVWDRFILCVPEVKESYVC